MSTIYNQLKQIIAEHEHIQQQGRDLHTLYHQMETIVTICDVGKASYPDKLKAIREIAAEAAGV